MIVPPEIGSLRKIPSLDFASALEMPGRGLEPLRIAPPDPKSGASANFATLAEIPATVLTQILAQSPVLQWHCPANLPQTRQTLYSAERESIYEASRGNSSGFGGINASHFPPRS